MTDGSVATNAAVTIGGTAAIIKVGATSRNAIIVQNLHATNDLYIGGSSGVTTSNGLKILAGESMLVPTRGDIYGIASGAGTDVRYFEVT